MVAPNDIINAVNELLVAKYPESSMYINLLPKDFFRPSFLIELPVFKKTAANFATVNVIAILTVTIYAPIDGHYNSDVDGINERMNNVLNIFSNGYLAVGDRCLAITDVYGTTDFTESIVELEFDFFDDRVAVSVTDPIIETVNINTVLEE